jgi:predicted RecA/RadA family phage recombinase
MHMPTAIRVHDGEILDHIPTTDVPVGAVVLLPALIGISQRPIPAGYLGALALSGVYEVPAVGNETGELGAPVFWHAVNQRAALATPPAGEAEQWRRLGVLAKPLAAADTRLRVAINR